MGTRLAIAATGLLLAGCGAAATTTPASSTPRSSPTPDLKATAAAAFDTASSSYITALNQGVDAFQAAAGRNDIPGVQAAAQQVYSATTSFDDAIDAITFPDSARTDSRALTQANAQLEAVMTEIRSADQFTLQSAAQQIPPAQQAQRSAINQLDIDLGLPPSFELGTPTASTGTPVSTPLP